EVRPAVRFHVGDLARDVADAVAAGDGGELQRAEHAERAALRVHERAAGVTRDARAGGVYGVVPAAGVLAEAQALLRRKLRDAEAERRVAVRQDLVALVDRVGDAGRATPERDARVDLRVVGRVQLDDREVVVLARVGVGLPVR